MTIRSEVVDLLVDRFEYGVTRTPEQEALLASATGPEWRAAGQIQRAQFEGEWRWFTGQATEEEEQFWAMMPGPAIFDGLPVTATVVLTAFRSWPWAKSTRDRILPVLARWSPQDRAALEERFAVLLEENGVHWDG